VGDLVAGLDAIEQGGARLVEAGRVVPYEGCAPGVAGSGSPHLDARWQTVADDVADLLLACSAMLVGAGTRATTAASTLREADTRAAAGMS
jgi:hypothetical protein